jgi:hypothetical protein
MEEFFKDAMGTTGGVFLPYGVLCLLGVLWMWRQVPETKGKTLEQIAGLFIGPRGD